MPPSRRERGHFGAAVGPLRLFQMVGNELGHFEHGHLGFAAEYCFELVVGIDHAAVGRILQVELFDVVPDLLGHFGTRQRRGRLRRRPIRRKASSLS